MIYDKNDDGTFSFHGDRIMRNGVVLHPFQTMGMPTVPWYYRSPSSPGNTRSYIEPVVNNPNLPFDFKNGN